jgi:predicted protein tyrosine phosphatase
MSGLQPTAYHDLSFAVTDRRTARSELNFRDSSWTHVVSIGDPGSNGVISRRRMGTRLLRLEFDDVTPGEGHGSSPQEIFTRFGYVAASTFQVMSIADFGRSLPEDAQLLVHCEHGVSRSAAAAAIVLMARFPDIRYPDALSAVRQSRPQASPNSWMLQLFLNMLTFRDAQDPCERGTT